MKFSFRGVDRAGAVVADVIEASDRLEATEVLRRRGVFASEITPAREQSADATVSVSGRRTGARLAQAGAFLRQLSILVSTGTPLVEAIESICRQQPAGPFRDMLESLHKRLEEGSQLSEAMEAFPAYFDGVCRSLVAAGESGGRLDAMLSRLAVFTRQQLRTRKTITGALIYPCLLMAVAVGVTGAMLGFVLPRFEGLFQTLDAPLPSSTRILMDLSHLVRDNWMVVVPALVALPTCGFLYATRTSQGRVLLERAALGAPIVGKLVRDFALARLARVLGVLLEGKVALLDAIRLARLSTGMMAYEAVLRRAEDAVMRGENFSVAINDPKLVAPTFVEAVRSGERSGQVHAVLLTLADAMDEDNDMALKTITGLLEPLILIFLGIIVGSMAISMFLPLFDLTAAGGHG
jgi:type IV pilus assembly protein PilC